MLILQAKKVRPPKDKTREALIKENGSLFETVKIFAQKDETLLAEYRQIVADKYKTLQISDNELDDKIYKSRHKSP